MFSLRRYWVTARNSQLVQNAGWNVLGSMSVALILPVVTIIVARMLSPSDYGIFGVAAALLAFLQIGKDFGLTQAIIVNEGGDDYRNLQFTVQLVWSTSLFVLIVLLAPWVAKFYHSDELRYVLPILGINLLLNAIIDPLQTAYLKEQNYKRLFLRQLIPTLVRSVILVSLAYVGFGVYTLVAGSVAGTLTDAFFLFWRSGWRPRLQWDRKQFRDFFKLGKHLMFQEFCGFLVLKADGLIVGKSLGMTSLGFYQMGNNLATMLPNSTIPQIAQVVFTDIANRKGDLHYLCRRYYQFIYLAGLSALVFSMAMYFAAKPLILLLLGQKWIGSVEVVQAFGLVVPLLPLSQLNVHISKIYDFNHVYSYFALVRGLITVSLVLLASFHSLQMVLVAWVASGMLGATLNNIIFFRSQNMVPIRSRYVMLYIAVCVWVLFGAASFII